MTDYNPSDAELEAEALAYIYGEGDFTDLPLVKIGPYDSPQRHPDHDTFDEDFAELQELAGRVHILLASKFRTDGEFSFTYDCYPDASIGRRTGHEFGFSPGFRFWPEDRAEALLVAWRSPESKAA